MSMVHQIEDGVWPTMITPFTASKTIDFDVLGKFVDWLIEKGVQGLFAVCQSSEMFYLTLEERVRLAQFVMERAAGRVQVIASGHISDGIADQIEEIKRISAVGIDAFVVVSNRLAGPDETEGIWKSNAEILLKHIPDVAFGVYECPYPYKRLLSPELLKWCADTGRFLFLKDTSCDLIQIQAKLDVVKGSKLKLFNANAATLLNSLKLGGSGFSGVMANFHPELYVKLLKTWSLHPGDAEHLQNYLGLASAIERQMYPVNAKYHLQLEGLPIRLTGRSLDELTFTSAMKLEIEQLRAVGQAYKD